MWNIFHINGKKQQRMNEIEEKHHKLHVWLSCVSSNTPCFFSKKSETVWQCHTLHRFALLCTSKVFVFSSSSFCLSANSSLFDSLAFEFHTFFGWYINGFWSRAIGHKIYFRLHLVFVFPHISVSPIKWACSLTSLVSLWGRKIFLLSKQHMCKGNVFYWHWQATKWIFFCYDFIIDVEQTSETRN